MNDKPDYLAGHRERLKNKYLSGKGLEDYEILELLLFYAIPRRDVKIIAKEIIRKFGSPWAAAIAPTEELVKVKGVKESTAVLIKLSADMMTRRQVLDMKENPIFIDMDLFYDYCINMLAGSKIEEFMVFHLDSGMKLIEVKKHSGTVNQCAVYTRAIVKDAVELKTSNVIIVHNHPDKIDRFSNEDMEITNQVFTALDSIGVRLFDHILVLGSAIRSMKEQGLRKFN